LLDYEPGAAAVAGSLRAAGYYVICVARSRRNASSADAYLAADEDTVALSAAIKNAARDKSILGVYTFSENSKFRQLELSRLLNVSGDPSETVLRARDKSHMRAALELAGLANHSWYFVRDSEPAGESRLPFPVVCKPNFGFASGGVRVVDDAAGYQQAVRAIRRLNALLLRSRAMGETGVVVEEFLSGPELAVDALTFNGTTRTFSICSKRYPEGNELIDFAYWSRCSPDEHPTLASAAARAVAALGYDFGPSHTEVRWDDRRQRWQVLEIALRVGFVGQIGAMIQAGTTVDYNLLAAQCYLREPAAEQGLLRPLAAKGVGVVFSPEIRAKGKFVGFRNLLALKNDPRVRSIEVLPDPGDWISPDGFNYCAIVVAVLDAEGEIDDFVAGCSEHLAIEVA